MTSLPVSSSSTSRRHGTRYYVAVCTGTYSIYSSVPPCTALSEYVLFTPSTNRPGTYLLPQVEKNEQFPLSSVPSGGAAAARRHHRAKQHRGYIGRESHRITPFGLYPASRVSGREPAGLENSKLLLVGTRYRASESVRTSQSSSGIVTCITGTGYLVRTGSESVRHGTGTYRVQTGTGNVY